MLSADATLFAASTDNRLLHGNGETGPWPHDIDESTPSELLPVRGRRRPGATAQLMRWPPNARICRVACLRALMADERAQRLQVRARTVDGIGDYVRFVANDRGSFALVASAMTSSRQTEHRQLARAQRIFRLRSETVTRSR